MAMVDFLRGRGPSSGEFPHQIMEFLLAKTFGWELEYIRNLSLADYKMLTKLMSIYQSARRNDPPPGLF